MEFKILTTWDDIKNNLIDVYLTNENENENKKYTEKLKKNKYNQINIRLKNKLYKNLNNLSAINTIKYIFYKIRSGIYVKIENNKLIAFIPFANRYFTNNWYKNISFVNSKNLKEFAFNRRKFYRYKKYYMPKLKNWWANAYIVNNEIIQDVWGQHSLIDYYNILTETLQVKKINNCQFIINKRDHPILNKNLLEPYINFYPQPQKIELRYRSKNYIPILSPYSNPEYLDIPFIIPQDWQLANKDTNYYKIEENYKWENKKEIAIFRGSATGSMEFNLNQRLQISKLDYEWKNLNLLDAGVVSWNSRDKIDSKLQLNYIKPSEMNNLGIFLKPKIPMNEQIKYKYIINIDGHSNPNRTSYLLQSGSLILMVESKYVIGNISWFKELLIPYKHYIPIKSDLSDLKEKIIWCKENDKECKKIVENSLKLYKKEFNKNDLINYCEYLLNQISNNFNLIS